MSASGEVRPNLRDQARMNIHRVVNVSAGGVSSDWNPEGLHYVWNDGGEARWRALQELLDRLVKAHKIDDRTSLEDAVDAAALIYHHGPGALPAADIKQFLESTPKVTEVLREENEARIASILMDRDNRLIAGRTWSKQRAKLRRIDGILKSGLVFNPGSLRTAPNRRMLLSLGLFDGWEYSYERSVAIRRRLSQIRKELSDLELCLRQLPRGRKGDRKFHGAVAVLKQRWKSLPGKKVSRTKFVESVMAFIDPNAVSKLPSATRHRLRGIAKIRA